MLTMSFWFARNSCFVAVVCLFGILGCTGGAAPQFESHVSITERGTVVGTTKFAFWQRQARTNGWEDNQKILIWVDFNYNAEVRGSDNKSRTRAYHNDGRGVVWEIGASQGEAVTISFDGKEYDLSKGALFLVKTNGGETEVRQLSTAVPDAGDEYENFEAFAKTDPDVREFIDAAGNSK